MALSRQVAPGGMTNRGADGLMEALAYYRDQSPITDPGEMARHLADLPHDLAGLQRAARGLVLHYRADNPSAYGIPEDRLGEVDSRYAEMMLSRLFDLDGRSLTEERPPEKRLLGCCRDYTVLFLTMARHRGIPARARVGFATYFIPGVNLDHGVAEVWDAGQEHWRLVDPELGDNHADPTDGFRVDPLDVPRDRFLVAGSAWQACRKGEVDPDRFLVDPGLDIEDTRGWPYLRHNLVHDLATLNKAEMLLWDGWGLIEQEQLSERDLQLLDHLAQATSSKDDSFDELRRLYQAEAGLQVPSAITTYSPASELPRTIMLDEFP